MHTNLLRPALLISLLFNLGVLGALGWQYLVERTQQPGEPLLVRELQLNEQQRQQWQHIEDPFLLELEQTTQAIQQQRNRLIDSIFTEPLDAERVSNEQQLLAAQQQHQQQLVIDQLLREREILNDQQRQRLAYLLTQQAMASSDVEKLHNE
ncbi:hypothetical protein BN1049_02530 [Pseudomonas saudimassiliensis]|uniref:Signaling pathway modulator ZraP n=1 Tax=Pseudomonas saudimassiliensis TaxID=1461581 RepID=A0A078MFS3_9PSED|nr:periplasmic heavy metal sensor [Pseudomonas saudimassiliensis]EZQ19185.1 hypothetical protein CF98_01560 [Halopseudomonas bauzanensis]CEA06153.1 hypothetical protein BN1049_02530 [Pseudomonas saudimassiliensis]CEF27578.1 hypothetical protein BN1049_02530 [Pseudomonas saudimassiliensis]